MFFTESKGHNIALYLVAVLLPATLVNHGILGWKIWKKKRKLLQSSGRIHSKTKVFIIFVHEPHSNQGDSSKSYLMDWLESSLFLCFLTSLPVTVAVLPAFMIGMPLLIIKVTSMLSFLVVVSLLIYLRKPHLRSALRKSLLKSWCKC